MTRTSCQATSFLTLAKIWHYFTSCIPIFICIFIQEYIQFKCTHISLQDYQDCFQVFARLTRSSLIHDKNTLSSHIFLNSCKDLALFYKLYTYIHLHLHTRIHSIQMHTYCSQMILFIHVQVPLTTCSQLIIFSKQLHSLNIRYNNTISSYSYEEVDKEYHIVLAIYTVQSKILTGGKFLTDGYCLSPYTLKCCTVFKHFDGLNFDGLAGKHQKLHNFPIKILRYTVTYNDAKLMQI